MVQSSFYGDTPNYATGYPTQNDSNTNTGPNTPAPSSFYPDGGVYEALANSDTTLAQMTALEAQAAADAAAAASSASSASTSATNAAASAASAAAAVAAKAGTATPIVDGTAAVGTSSKWAHEDHVHPTDTSRADAAATTAALALKAPLASPALTGNPTAPTAAVDDNDTSIATTAFVLGQAASATPSMDGTAAAGTSTRFARGDHIHPTDTSRAPLASPNFSGTPTAPTPTVGDNSTKVATTAYVLANAATATPLVNSGSGAVGTATKYAREDHVHPTDTTLAPYEAQSFNNILINGGMEVDQANVGGATPANGYAVDCWNVSKAGTMVCSAQQVSDAPPGFSSSIKVTVSTAQASLGSTDGLAIYSPIEGYRTSKLQFGAAAALTITVGFWVKIHRPGTYSGAILNYAQTRTYPFTFTQNVADTWEYKTVTIPGDTAGAWVGNTNAGAMYVMFSMARGSAGVGTANTWATAGYYGVTGTTNGVAATSDIFQITGVSLLPGSVAVSAASSPLLKRTFSEELQLCRRYFQKSYAYGTAPGTSVGAGNNSLYIGGSAGGAYMSGAVVFPVALRATPTLTIYNNSGGGGTGSYYNAGWVNGLSIALAGLTDTACGFFAGTSGVTALVNFDYKADARL